ncbi:SURF1 family protein [Parasedimentitalea psychrophila]|uniref:SURF1-like protein n=1 Tax=Parasedimentitalea psychrophila TaxID=2997337 RepID=A0A9Y2L1F8_9RHOB|nr:SURF1 family protein [Parasedimentitalea psychrophila]WIY25911.1 SURF1 family protein [Parasedimentitalea psychrophila]
MRRLIFLLVVGLAGLVVLLSLGAWQVQRMAWKQQILDIIDARVVAEPVALPLNPDPLADKYRPVRLLGEMAAGELLVLISTRELGPGFRVIVPFVTEDGRRILVDRGFIRAAAKKSTRNTGKAELIGNLHWPDETDSYTPAADTANNIWYARDVVAMAAALDSLPILVVLNGHPINGSSVLPMPINSASIPNDHLQYAITWFSLALIWAAMTAYFLWRPRAKTES